MKPEWSERIFKGDDAREWLLWEDREFINEKWTRIKVEYGSWSKDGVDEQGNPAQLVYETYTKVFGMKARFTYWKESDGRYLAYLNDYPDHWTQGENLDDLKEHLKDLFGTFNAEQIPGIRKVEELGVA
jgi:hypothetical protein